MPWCLSRVLIQLSRNRSQFLRLPGCKWYLTCVACRKPHDPRHVGLNTWPKLSGCASRFPLAPWGRGERDCLRACVPVACPWLSRLPVRRPMCRHLRLYLAIPTCRQTACTSGAGVLHPNGPIQACALREVGFARCESLIGFVTS